MLMSRDAAPGAQLLSSETDNEDIDFSHLGCREERMWGHEEKHLITRLKKI